ncbi:MAG: NPCBM/NEW2 domain-containing protein [Planctomycetes bacterium]|nr:NPCBM/NEW2 domain-containing protein [Planctomycetota bacterium]
MLCFRVIFWGIVLIVWAIPGFFLVGIIGRLGGFRPGSKPGPVGKVFGWFGIVFLGGMMLGVCVVAGLIDWGISSFVAGLPEHPPNGPPFFEHQPQGDQHPSLQQRPSPRAIPPEWVDAKMEKVFLSDLQEFGIRVGWGSFGKRGDLGYDVFQNRRIVVNGQPSPNGISMHPPAFGFSTVKYRLNRAYKLFIGDAALTDVENPGFRPQTPAQFCVLGDNQLLWRSLQLDRAAAAEWCRINVEGVDILELQVHCPGGHSHVRAVWLEPHLLK